MEERPFNVWANNILVQLDLIHEKRKQIAEENFKQILGKDYGESNKRNKRIIKYDKTAVR